MGGKRDDDNFETIERWKAKKKLFSDVSLLNNLSDFPKSEKKHFPLVNWIDEGEMKSNKEIKNNSRDKTETAARHFYKLASK